MKRKFEALFIKPGIGIKDLEKYGFKGHVWKPHYNCLKYEKEYYNDETDYVVRIHPNGQIVIMPNGWTQISGKIQTLLFDMFKDDILEKRTIVFDTKELE